MDRSIREFLTETRVQLKPHVSYRKQRIGVVSNRNTFQSRRIAASSIFYRESRAKLRRERKGPFSAGAIDLGVEAKHFVVLLVSKLFSVEKRRTLKSQPPRLVACELLAYVYRKMTRMSKGLRGVLGAFLRLQQFDGEKSKAGPKVKNAGRLPALREGARRKMQIRLLPRRREPPSHPTRWGDWSESR